MIEIIAKIKAAGIDTEKIELNKNNVIWCQRELKLNNMPTIPTEMVEFLNYYNSFAYDGSHLFGVLPKDEESFDILYENNFINCPNRENILFLGFDELEYLVWNKKEKQYQTIDKDSFEVLNSYKNCNRALTEFLKLNND